MGAAILAANSNPGADVCSGSAVGEEEEKQ